MISEGSLFCRTGRHIAGDDPATVETQMRTCSAAQDVTTGPAVSVWTRADARSTAAERPGCMAVSSAAAWFVHRNKGTLREATCVFPTESEAVLYIKSQSMLCSALFSSKWSAELGRFKYLSLICCSALCEGWDNYHLSNSRCGNTSACEL